MILNILVVTTIIRKLDLDEYSFLKCVYKRYSDKTKCMYFMIEDENLLMNI